MATRDIPKSFRQLTLGWLYNAKDEVTFNRTNQELIDDDFQPYLDEKVEKVERKNLWPAFVSGAGLFSDGYVNNSIGTTMTCLETLYPTEITKSNAINNVASIAFVGTVIGMLGFGYISDNYARKSGMMTANVMLILFTALCAAATWGVTVQGMFASLTVFRFFLGIGIGAEYPTSSVIAAEFANQLPAGKRNRYFSWFTNAMIDVGFIVSSFVPMVLLWICTPKHLTPVWRITLAFGVLPPFILFFLRLKIKDSECFKRHNMKKAKVPYLLILKFYGFRLAIISLVWFIYDFSSYSFGLFSSLIIKEIVPGDDMYKTFGWNVVFNLFYIPGAFLGALSADYFGPRLTAGCGVLVQAVVGFIMAGCFPQLKKHVAGFVVVFGIFSTIGEFSLGDNTGLLASKTSATPIRGQYYGIASASGKIGAFVGTYVFPIIQKKGLQIGGENGQSELPFYVSSALCVFAGLIVLFFVPSVDQNSVNREDESFLEYLTSKGYDIKQLGEVVDNESGILSYDDKQKESGDVNVDINKVETNSISSKSKSTGTNIIQSIKNIKK